MRTNTIQLFKKAALFLTIASVLSSCDFFEKHTEEARKTIKQEQAEAEKRRLIERKISQWRYVSDQIVARKMKKNDPKLIAAKRTRYEQSLHGVETFYFEKNIVTADITKSHIFTHESWSRPYNFSDLETEKIEEARQAHEEAKKNHKSGHWFKFTAE